MQIRSITLITSIFCFTAIGAISWDWFFSSFETDAFAQAIIQPQAPLVESAIAQDPIDLAGAIKLIPPCMEEKLTEYHQKTKIKSEKFRCNGITIHLTDHDITKMPVDAIVNAANKTLPWPAGGVCRVIYLAAGHQKLNNWVKANIKADKKGVRLGLGKALATPSFDLEAVGIKHIIHTVGPDARIEEPTSALYDAYKNSLLLADQLKVSSIAFPAISIGIFECDKKEVATYALKAINEIAPQTNIKDIYLTILDDEYYQMCKDILI